MLLVLVLVALVLVPLSPAIQHTPTRDSGIFLYVSSRLLDGDALYRQVWDHKPPLVFWINALGLAFSGHSIWGVWVMQFAFLFLTCLLGYALVRRAFGRWPGAVALSAALLTLSYVLHGGNTTERMPLVPAWGGAGLREGHATLPALGLGGVLRGLPGTGLVYQAEPDRSGYGHRRLPGAGGVVHPKRTPAAEPGCHWAGGGGCDWPDPGLFCVAAFPGPLLGCGFRL